MPIVEVHNLKKYFATQKAVDDVTFSIEKGSIFGLLGPNGAGKTTLIRMITGIFFPDEGEIIFDGKKFHPLDDIINIDAGDVLAILRIRCVGIVQRHDRYVQHQRPA